jgi:hypothetical protein
MYKVTRDSIACVCLFDCLFVHMCILHKCPKFTVIRHSCYEHSSIINQVPSSPSTLSSLLEVLQRIRLLREVGKIS